ncbi:MAG TPA: hypothetical protein G4N92_06130 [Anaerolineae bacterium]|nr:hypothetical protein [Anaerolineae bacterium]
MIYGKNIFVMGIVFLILSILGSMQGNIYNSVGFIALAISTFMAFDKNNPDVKYPKIREIIYWIGFATAGAVWLYDIIVNV